MTLCIIRFSKIFSVDTHASIAYKRTELTTLNGYGRQLWGGGRLYFDASLRIELMLGAFCSVSLKFGLKLSSLSLFANPMTTAYLGTGGGKTSCIHFIPYQRAKNRPLGNTYHYIVRLRPISTVVFAIVTIRRLYLVYNLVFACNEHISK